MSERCHVNTFRISARHLAEMQAIIHPPRSLTGLRHFLSYYRDSLRLILQEPEILLFVFLQWIVIALGCYVFLLGLHSIPEDTWDMMQNYRSGSRKGNPFWYLIAFWTLMCAAIAAPLINTLSSCIPAVHILRCEGRSSTIFACLQLVIPRLGTLWALRLLDISISLKRLLGGNKQVSGNWHIPEKWFYRAWKVTAMSALANLVAGRSIRQAALNTVEMADDYAQHMCAIRIGYVSLCWAVGLTTYAVAALNYQVILNFVLSHGQSQFMANALMALGAPAIIAVMVIQLLIKPVYLLALSDVFVRYVVEKNERILPARGPASTGKRAMLVACSVALCAAYAFRNELGIVTFVSKFQGIEQVATGLIN